jgi:phosphoglycolate phosphatase
MPLLHFMLFPMSTRLRNIQSVIFDFDYTLVDSSAASIECISFALNNMQLPVPAPELICKTIGMSLENTLKALTRIDDQISAKEFRRLFTLRADHVMLDLIVFLSGAKQVLSELDKRGIMLGIVSNKYRYRIEAFLQRENLEGLIDVIVGFEDTTKPKPEPDPLLFAISKLGRPREQTVYVGDSLIDAETASRTGISFIAVLTGVTTRQDFAGYFPCSIINNLQELPELLA